MQVQFDAFEAATPLPAALLAKGLPFVLFQTGLYLGPELGQVVVGHVYVSGLCSLHRPHGHHHARTGRVGSS